MGNVLFDFIGKNYASLFIISVMIIFFFINRGKKLEIRVYFYTLVMLVFIEIVRAFLDERASGVPKFYLAAVGYVLRPLLLYLVALAMARDWKRLPRILLGIPLYVDTILLLFGHWMGRNVYWFTGRNYDWGPWLSIIKYSIVYFLIVIIVVATTVCKKSIWEAIIVLISCFFIILNYINEVIFEAAKYSLQNTAISISVFIYYMYFCTQDHYDQIDEKENEITVAKEKVTMEMVDQAIETLAYTIDVKDSYTRGHSVRVAKYSRMIGEAMGKSSEECREIYLTGLLHDIGKIYVPEEVINKSGKLTKDEYEQVKQHPTNGAKVLVRMKNIPYLQDGAKYHHERYDGKGYPCGISGEDIPEYARIIAVADAYDAMTSYRSYRAVMDQSAVREEIWKGVGTQFDPYFAKIMVALIDADLNYELRENKEVQDEVMINSTLMANRSGEDKAVALKEEEPRLQSTDIAYFGEFIKTVDHWLDPIGNALVSLEGVEVSLLSKMFGNANRVWHTPCAIIYSASDGVVGGRDYMELAIIKFNGYAWKVPPALDDKQSIVRKDAFTNWDSWMEESKSGMKYYVSVTRKGTLVRSVIDSKYFHIESDLQLPNLYDKDIYVSFSGENCRIEDLKIY